MSEERYFHLKFLVFAEKMSNSGSSPVTKNGAKRNNTVGGEK